MAEYPSREPFFAHKAIRLMIRVCAAQDIGSDAFALVTVIAHTEDAKRYTGPVTWWNDQLRPVLGFSSWGKLDRARKRAVEAGWLYYQPGGHGKVGEYWVTIPPGLDGVPDGPVDEDHPAILSTSGAPNGRIDTSSSPPVERQTGSKRDLNGMKTGDSRSACGALSSLSPSPNPNPYPKGDILHFDGQTEDEIAPSKIWHFAEHIYDRAIFPPSMTIPQKSTLLRIVVLMLEGKLPRGLVAESIRGMKERDGKPIKDPAAYLVSAMMGHKQFKAATILRGLDDVPFPKNLLQAWK